MPQGWITRVEKDQGWISQDGGVTEKGFRHWALAAEMGGRFPRVGDYVQFRQLVDPTRGPYIMEVRQLTPPASGPPVRNVYPVIAQEEPGIKRMVEGQKVPLEQAIAQAHAATTQGDPTSNIRRVTSPGETNTTEDRS
jgi:hypothetical protein